MTEVLAVATLLGNLDRFGFGDARAEAPLATSDLEVPAGASFATVARASATTTARLHGDDRSALNSFLPSVFLTFPSAASFFSVVATTAAGSGESVCQPAFSIRGAMSFGANGPFAAASTSSAYSEEVFPDADLARGFPAFAARAFVGRCAFWVPLRFLVLGFAGAALLALEGAAAAGAGAGVDRGAATGWGLAICDHTESSALIAETRTALRAASSASSSSLLAPLNFGLRPRSFATVIVVTSIGASITPCTSPSRS